MDDVLYCVFSFEMYTNYVTIHYMLQMFCPPYVSSIMLFLLKCCSCFPLHMQPWGGHLHRNGSRGPAVSVKRPHNRWYFMNYSWDLESYRGIFAKKVDLHFELLKKLGITQITLSAFMLCT